MDPKNYQHVFVLDIQYRVWASFDEGVSWVNLTANLPSLTENVRAIEILGGDTLTVGGLRGVFRRDPDSEEKDPWHVLGKGFPAALVLDLHFNTADNTLVAGSLGRGAWTLANIFGDRPDAAAVEARRLNSSRAAERGFNPDVPLAPPVAPPAKKPLDE
jgi:hypothetical protein